ncbi:hypothetical protein SM124_05965 [Bacillus sp. 31A1R]|uniref:Lipoprotein n=1 Tax=Robertmurraya mangrovi TaxID=3098077 RepID=A0ABU5IVU7_9BACI|nr:hypothetical protein [Bacillus sp. 31A1R]MDZ5471288.1 hypothetical protein [Bacillus sp. 31A1R]
MKKWFIAWTLLIQLILTGCSFQVTENQSEGEEKKPPKAFIEVQNETYETVLGTYCWRYKNEGTCVDYAGPEELLKDKTPIKVQPEEIVTFKMNYKPFPNEFHVLQISEGKQVEIQIKDNSFTAPTEKGTYYYSYGVWWMDKKQKHVSKGDAFYNFALEVIKD